MRCLMSWNLEYKLITPKNITSTYFGTIVAIFNFSFSVCFLYVMFFLTPERAPKASPATCFLMLPYSAVLHENIVSFYQVVKNSKEVDM